MRKGRNRENEKRIENNGENSGPLSSLPVNRLNGNRVQRRRSCQFKSEISQATVQIFQNRKKLVNPELEPVILNTITPIFGTKIILAL